MYEQISHSILNDILKKLEPKLDGHDLHYFYIRIGANFYAIYSLFQKLYGQRDDFKEQLAILVECLARNYIDRSPALKTKDLARERHFDWFQHQKWTGMALYTKGFGGNLQGVSDRLSYFTELGVNLVHIMPILQCPEKRSDGGYAVSNFREIDSRAGSLDDLDVLITKLHAREMLLVLDVVVNHTSDEHAWAQQARAGSLQYQDYYYLFDDQDYYYLFDGRTVPDQYEETMQEVFPTSSPGNFTWNAEMQKWVMTVFHNYQWDLNYKNPAVFIEMIDIILFWANKGADIIRLDAVAFLWKKIGTICQNEREAHLLLQLMKDCCQVTAPGMLFIAEAIVAPSEINKYFGEDAVIAKECEIAYNATFMALMWDAIATHNSKLLSQGITSLPQKLDGATWLNYIRCHDDIGLGFTNEDIVAAGYKPWAHRRFLLDYFTGNFEGSTARGLPFAKNEKTGDARISGSLASLVGLESALESGDPVLIKAAIDRILLLHGLILSFGGLPLIYYGDELGALNDYTQLNNPDLSNDTRWIHRPEINWDLAEERHQIGTPTNMIFSGIRNMIAVRRELNAFADYNNRQLVDTGNDCIFGFLRYQQRAASGGVLVFANFADVDEIVPATNFRLSGFGWPGLPVDQITNQRPVMDDEGLVVPARSVLWLMQAN